MAQQTRAFVRPLPPRRRARLIAAATAMGLGVLAPAAYAVGPQASASSSEHSATEKRAVPKTTRAYKPKKSIFGPSSEWRRDVSRAPLSPDSAGLVANLAEQVAVRYNGVASFNFYQYHVSFYSVRPGLRRANVLFDNCQKKPYLPGQLYDPARGAQFTNVPIPARAIPAAGSDGELSIYDPSTDQLWEFWKAVKKDDGWHACWGGRIDNVSTSPGYFTDGMGVAATGLSVSAGSIGIREMQAGKIKHAINLNVVDAAHWSTYSYPAQRSDGNQAAGTPNAIMEGQRFRLDPSIDVNSLSLTPIARAIAVAAQKYGFIVNDKGGSVSVMAESGAGMASRRGVDPWTALRAGTPGYDVLKNFPWSSLQALPANYGKP